MKNPVCQMMVGEHSLHLEVRNKRCYFCSEGCLRKFQDDDEAI